MRPFLCLFAFFLPSLALAEPLKAVASFSILGDMVQQVGGDLVEVSTIVGPDSDAHVYSPTVSDARQVAKADIIFVNGLGFEGWVADLIEASGNSAPVIVVTDGITPLMVEGQADPHAWNDLSNGQAYANAIAEGLSLLLPLETEAIENRRAAFNAEISDLLSQAKTDFDALPSAKRTIVTGHDAFGYFEAQFSLSFIAPLGVNTEAEPSARELARLIRQIREAQVGGLFVENITNPDLVAQIAEETGLSIGGRLYSDALSARGGPATSYLAMMEHNIAVLLETLNN